MKKIFFGLSVFLSALISAQNYPDHYPTNANNNNSSYYGDEEDATYFPDDYYYEYPSDYYTNDFYQSSYNDYRNSIYDVNWNSFFARHRLSSWQIQQIMILNDSYPSYSAWNSYYRYNPDRWYYDRFYALQNIMGPRIFVVFQNNYYHGYNPVVYYQNYRRQHYVTNIYVVPRYRNININRYRIDRTQYQQNNPRQEMGFRDNGRNTNGNWQNNSNNSGFRSNDNLSTTPRNSGFRSNADTAVKTNPQLNDSGFRNNSDIKPQTTTPQTSGGFRNNAETAVKTSPQINNGGFRSNSDVRPQSTAPQNNGFRNNNSGSRNSDAGLRNKSQERKIEKNSSQQKRAPELRTSNSSGFRFTGR